MKKTISLLAILILLPVTTHAFSLDDAILVYVNYLKGKIETLEAENELLKSQCTSNIALVEEPQRYTLGTSEKKELNFANILVEPFTREGENFVNVDIDGVFDRARFKITNPDGYVVATPSFTKATEYESGAYNETGIYKWQLGVERGDDVQVIHGEFVI